MSASGSQCSQNQKQKEGQLVAWRNLGVVEKVEVHLPPLPAARCATVVNRRSNISASEEDEGIQLQPRCYTQLGEKVNKWGGGREIK